MNTSSIFRTKLYRSKRWSRLPWLGIVVSVILGSLPFYACEDEDHQSINRLRPTQHDANFELVDSAAISTAKSGPMLLVGTIDGRLSAFTADARDMTTPVWTLDTSPEALLSSSLSKIELVRDGEKIQLIPSLDGNLFSFNGDRIEPLPVSADSLLSSSFKISEDSVISGAKETKIYGLDAHSGKVRYACAAGGCTTLEEEVDAGPADNHRHQDTLVVRRLSQTVRAFDIHRGSENWNFSVGSLDLTMASSQRHLTSRHDCSFFPASDMSFRFEIATGTIRALSTSGGHQELWHHQLPNAITGAWVVENGCVDQLDLVTGMPIRLSDHNAAAPHRKHPVIYIGHFAEQLYIQYATLPPFHHLSNKYPQATFRPWLVHAPSRTAPVIAPAYRPLVKTALNSLYFPKSGPSKDAVVSIGLHEYPFAHGYFLSEEDMTARNNLTIPSDSAERAFIFRLVWNWAGFAGLVVALTAGGWLLRGRFKMRRPPPLQHAASSSSSKSITSVLSLQELNGKTSRFESDFEVLEQLGKGGFGVVYSAKNRLDDNIYAVKKIRLPRSDAGREKVRREVRVLAKLDHVGIVRFYNAWVEAGDFEPTVLVGGASDIDSDGAELMSATSVVSSLNLVDDWIGTRQRNPLSISEDFHSKLSDTTADPTDHDKSVEIVFQDGSDGASEQHVVAADGDRPSVGKFFGSRKKSRSRSSHSNKSTPSLTGLSELDHSSGTKGPPPEGIVRLRPQLFIQMELCRKETLKDWLKLHNEVRNRNHILDIFLQISRAVEYIHRLGLMHRDLKPSNVLFSLDATAVKIADFGLVTATDDEDAQSAVIPADVFSLHGQGNHTNRVGTSLYMSPELIAGRGYCEKIDIYSLGLIYLELLLPFLTEMERVICLTEAKQLRFAVYRRDSNGRVIGLDEGKPWTRSGDEELLLQLLAQEPDDRPTAGDLCRNARLFGDLIAVYNQGGGGEGGSVGDNSRSRVNSFAFPNSS
ncbi:Eukaryotic translation initiation factor 2-alpha kinase 3 [Hypsibius exemplaris]|uniref:PRKR-like endoplasmic reticulum kinase n=1 Tax=Hypsibius exemplaris TaxID=2072580 RepID=A0A1W0XBN2_HYPEX|nr:Eukaryotic translation initiation factor 2-alpha kinase 3 [Hypsibius exemplaris]